MAVQNLNQPTSKDNLKLLLLIGALLLSAAPVQASEKFKQIIQPCDASEETYNACNAMAIHFSAIAYYRYLCMLEEAGKTTPEVFSEKAKVIGKTERRKEIAKVAFNAAVKKVQDKFPNCLIKPLR